MLSLIAMGLACTMIGRYIAYKLSRRVRILEKIALMLEIAENEIQFLNRPTFELIELLSKKEELAELEALKPEHTAVNKADGYTAAKEAFEAFTFNNLMTVKATLDLKYICNHSLKYVGTYKKGFYVLQVWKK